MVAGAAHRPFRGKQPRSERDVAAVTCKPRKRVRKAKQAHGGKPAISVGLASGLDRNYKRLVMFENRARYLADPERRCVVPGDLEGDQELLQKELDLMRGHSF
jgi:hypothetical protein